MNLCALARFLYPTRCVVCRSAGPAICATCRPRLSESRRFERAGLSIVAVGPYAGPLRTAVLGFKRGRRDAAAPLAAMLATVLEREKVPRDYLVVPAPTTRARALARGFDQSVLLARELAAIDRRPILLALQKNARDGQRGRSRVERLRARERFRCTSPGLIAGAEVILLDDVVTTGATLADCARSLREGGARVRGAFVLAYA